MARIIDEGKRIPDDRALSSTCPWEAVVFQPGAGGGKPLPYETQSNLPGFVL